jgi:hypothetical protein
MPAQTRKPVLSTLKLHVSARPYLRLSPMDFQRTSCQPSSWLVIAAQQIRRQRLSIMRSPFHAHVAISLRTYTLLSHIVKPVRCLLLVSTLSKTIISCIALQLSFLRCLVFSARKIPETSILKPEKKWKSAGSIVKFKPCGRAKSPATFQFMKSTLQTS